MKKNIIALAVAGVLAAPLAAQAEVTVSGQLQAEITSLSADENLGVTEGLYMHDAQEGGSPDSGNYGTIAVSATEDLGNGMKAIAKYAMNVNATENDKAPLVGRDAYIGLSGSFGTVLAGTIATPYKTSTVKWDPFLATAGQARGNYGASKLHNGYAENVLAYANQFGPAKVVIATSFDESDDKENFGAGDGETDGENTNTASVNVPFGPVEVAVAYLDNSAVDDGTATKLGVRYAAGPISASFQYENLDAGIADSGNDGETFVLLNGTYTMGANTFALSYGMNTVSYVGMDDTDNTHTTAGIVHSFSKTTSVHAAYTIVDIDGDAANGLALGMRVKF